MLSVKTMVSSFKTWSLPMQNSYCDHRNFDSVIKPAFQDKRSNVLLFFALRELALHEDLTSKVVRTKTTSVVMTEFNSILICGMFG
jgi:hypothetical protein